MTATQNLCLTFGLTAINNELLETRQAKFGTEVEHKRTYKFYINHCLYVTVTNMATQRNRGYT
jgi:hypothetical protein